MPTPVSGKNGRVTCDGTTLYLTEWTVREHTDQLDTTNFESLGFGEQVPGILQATITLSGYYDVGIPPMADPPNLGSGSQVANLNCIINKTLNNKYLFPIADVEDSEVKVPVRGRVDFTATLKSNGTYTRPTT